MKKISFILFAMITMGFMSCSKNDQGATTKLEVRLTDSPGDYQEVNINIQDVQVNTQTGETGWQSLSVKKGFYNLLSLTNGLDSLIGTATLPVGRINQIRLVLGSNNTLKVNDQIVALTTPSAEQSGLKLVVDAELKAGVTYKLLLDFDVARSIVVTGGNTYKLKPVVRVITQALTGAIKGVITPVISTPAVYAIIGTDTLATTYADSVSGKFLLQGLTANTYLISFAPKTGYIPLTKASVNVTVGNVTDLGTVPILQ